MHLFITDQFTTIADNITIYEDRIIHQCSRVLRMKPSNQILIQDHHTRYTITLIECNKKHLIGTITTKETLSHPLQKTIMYIARPNRWDKAEFITQKLTEIGCDEIIFWKAERSQPQNFPEKKQERMKTIALEAAEQSFRHHVPKLSFLEKWDENCII